MNEIIMLPPMKKDVSYITPLDEKGKPANDFYDPNLEARREYNKLIERLNHGRTKGKRIIQYDTIKSRIYMD